MEKREEIWAPPKSQQEKKTYFLFYSIINTLSNFVITWLRHSDFEMKWFWWADEQNSCFVPGNLRWMNIQN